jgi:PBSX family phage portal protein
VTKKTEDEKPSAQVLQLTSLSGDPTKVQKFDKVRRNKEPAPEGAIQSNAAESEDEYRTLYIGAADEKGILEPPYNLRLLDRLSQENNALSPCIEAMVTNVDGTGYDFASADEEVEDDEDDSKIEQLNEFFAEPWPGESFVTIRKKLRRDLERMGNAYLEVLRNAQDEVTFIRWVDAKMMRLLKLDSAIPVEKTIRRNGKDLKVTVMERQRRFCQLLNGLTLVYFKEFGVDRDLDKNRGTWAQKGQRLAANARASEIIHFTALPDAKTPYGVPRWINQLPSVLGSRKAEEFNLDFFDNGGVPPALIILQGGTLQSTTRAAIEKKAVFGGPSDKNRLQVLEVEPSGGSLDHPTQARVTVERFGGERQNDSMFEDYDAKCETRIRRSFRLAPIFVGAAEDYSFASAFVSYNVTEAQVFKPERDEFDEIITMKLLVAMGYRGYKLVSKPLTIEDPNLKLQGIEIALSTNQVEMEDVLYEINEACGTDIRVSEEPDVDPNAQMTVDEFGNIVPLTPQIGHNGGPALEDDVVVEEESKKVKTKTKGKAKDAKKPATSQTPVDAPKPSSAKKSASQGVLALAQDTLIAFRERDFASLSKNVQLIATFDAHGRAEFQKACASLQFVDPSHDPQGLGELMSCTIHVMQDEHRAHAH